MRCYKYLAVCLLIFLSIEGFSQTPDNYKWWNPADNSFPTVEGRGWQDGLKDYYDRMPAKAEATVRQDVWNLSKHSAGLYIKFRTNSADLIVKYVATNTKNFGMPHMPPTGVSGVDLYAIDQSGKWVWAPGKYSFGDTIVYRFSNMEVDPVFKNRDCEFRLFLPLYNGVSWMQIGVPNDKNFIPQPLTPEKPVVVYGTSIAQGGCASRPGLAWTSILERKLDLPLINLAFSGNGRLEQPVIDLINEIDAQLYVLDCLPNMVSSGGCTDEELEKRLITSVKSLKQKHPDAPILLVEHSLSSTTNIIDTVRNRECEKANKVLKKVFLQLKTEGIKEIYTLTNEAIGLNTDATVDGVHPNDVGMESYANAYAKIIHDILHEPEGEYSTMKPIIQSRDGYDWRGRHEAIKVLNKKNNAPNIILANSIIHYWAGEPVAHRASGKDSWDKYLAPLGLQNMGFGWDRIENVLWRVYHGALDGYTPKHIIVMIGTNNLQLNTDEEIIAGLQQLLEAIHFRQPTTSILLSGIFPRRDMEKRVVVINKAIAGLAVKSKVTYIDPGKVLLNAAGKIDEKFFSDGLHPNADGYNKLAPVIAGYLKK
ncbi:MAG: SGNH/GDSL hydrolase family protein [Agriterribacter sp.]